MHGLEDTAREETLSDPNQYILHVTKNKWLYKQCFHACISNPLIQCNSIVVSKIIIANDNVSKKRK